MTTRILTLLATLLLAHAAPASPTLTFLGASTTGMENPHDLKLAPDGSRLMVSDVGNNRVLILDPETLEPIGAFGSDQQSGTHDVDFDNDGRIYVADTHNNRVLIYRESEGGFVVEGELSEGIRGPEGVLAHPGGRIYVAGAWSGNLVAYESGRPVAELGGLSSPHDVELAPSGDIWLADAGNDRMLLVTPNLEIIRELSGPSYDFDGVRYQDVMPDGTLIAADKNNHVVKIISADGVLLKVLGTGKPGLGEGIFRTPEGVEIRGDIVWISDSGNDRVVKYRIAF